MSRLNGTFDLDMTGSQETWQITKPKWVGKARRPVAEIRSRFEMPSGGVDDLILIIPLVGWLFLVIASAIEATIHALVVNPLRWISSPTARRAGWDFDVTYGVPADPRVGPTPKRLTITTMRSPSRAAADHVRTRLVNGLVPGMTLADPPVRDLLAATSTIVIGERTTYQG